jgi:DNA repair protein RadC
MEQELKIQDMSQADRPREKLIAKGPDALTNAELLAVILGQGIPGCPILSVCNQLAESVGNDLSILARLTQADFCKIKGIGQAKALLLIAALELGERRKLHENDLKIIKDEQQVTRLVFPYFLKSKSPQWLLILVNHRQELLATSELQTAELEHPQLSALLKMILESGASGFWIARSSVNQKKDNSWLKGIQSGSRMLNLEFYGQVIIRLTG